MESSVKREEERIGSPAVQKAHTPGQHLFYCAPAPEFKTLIKFKDRLAAPAGSQPRGVETRNPVTPSRLHQSPPNTP